MEFHEYEREKRSLRARESHWVREAAKLLRTVFSLYQLVLLSRLYRSKIFATCVLQLGVAWLREPLKRLHTYRDSEKERNEP